MSNVAIFLLLALAVGAWMERDDPGLITTMCILMCLAGVAFAVSLMFGG